MLTKRSAFILLAVALIVPLLWWLQNRMKPQHEETAVSQPNDFVSKSLTEQMVAGLDAYYQLATALTRSDSVGAARYAVRTDSLIRRIDLPAGISDTSAIPFLDSLKAGSGQAAQKIAAANSLEEQRIQFEALSNQLYDLLRAGQFLSIRTYKVYCPMAFNNRGASWLSPDPAVVNPYFGASMLHCGEVKDSMGTTTTPH